MKPQYQLNLTSQHYTAIQLLRLKIQNLSKIFRPAKIGRIGCSAPPLLTGLVFGSEPNFEKSGGLDGKDIHRCHPNGHGIGWPMVRAVGAVVAQLLYTETVGGSNPSSPTSLRSERSGERRLPRRSETKTGQDTQLFSDAPNYGSAGQPITAKSEAAAPKLKAQAGWHIRPPTTAQSYGSASQSLLFAAGQTDYFSSTKVPSWRKRIFCPRHSTVFPKNAPIQTAA